MPQPLVLPLYSTLPRVNLGVGDIVVVDQPTTVWTVLGSCVAVILRVPRLGMSAICHAQLPEPPPGSWPSCIDACPKPCDQEPVKDRAMRYVTCGIRKMLAELQQRGALKMEMVASLYGGGNVVSLIAADRSVSDRNVAIARSMLEEEGIPIVFTDVGGTRGRNIEHDSGTNQTVVRYHAQGF
jgi:chemotaxis receptor (MCP) glutamine deamidase CheD